MKALEAEGDVKAVLQPLLKEGIAIIRAEMERVSCSVNRTLDGLGTEEEVRQDFPTI